MEETSEIALESGCIPETIPMSCIPEDDETEESGSLTPEAGIWKVFKNKAYNQKDVDAYACTLVAAFNSLANGKDVDVPQEVINVAFEDFRDSGKFIPHVGAKISDGASFALKHFNAHFGTSVKMEVLPFGADNIILSLKGGFAPTGWIKYGSEYVKNEQDDGIVQNTVGTIGKQGHCVSFVKLNTTDPGMVQLKFEENYHGYFKFDIVYVNVTELRALFQNSIVRFFE